MRSIRHLLGKRCHLMNSDPFILVIGTSHSAGACADRDWQKWGIKNTPLLAYHDRWTSLMEKDLGIKVINLSKPGTINSRILAILADAFDRGMSNCKAVIVECRLGVGGSAISYNGFLDYEHFPDGWEKHLIRDIDGTIEHGLKDDAFSRIFGVYAGGKVQKPGYSEKLLGAVYPDDAVPKEAVKHIEEYIEQRSNFYHRTDHVWWDDFFDIRNMQTMCENANIPFRWMHWGKANTIEYLMNYLLTEYPKVGPANLLAIEDNYIAGIWNHFRFELGFDGDDMSIQCSCKHFNELGNKIAWEVIIKPRVEEWLNDKL